MPEEERQGILGLFDRLFNRKKGLVTAKDLKVALMGVKRERKKKHMQLRKLAQKRNDVLERVKQARKDGNGMEVDVLWEELKQFKVDAAYAKREAKVLSLESVGLTRYMKGLERLEKTGDTARIKTLLDKAKLQGLDEKLRGVEVDEMAYMDALNANLEDLGLDMEDWESEDEDPEKANFLAEIDEIVSAEDAGKLEVAIEKQEKLNQKLETDAKLEPEDESAG